MNDTSRSPLVYKPVNKVRFVTAASLFDGHDASINIMRRILQATGCEVIHLGHNRSVEEIVNCALQEDAHGIAISSYQGGHVEFFKYMLDLLRERGGAHIKVFGGGGGVIVPAEIKELHDYGVTRIFSPEDGQKLGLQGMINEIVAACDVDLAHDLPADLARADRRRPLRPRACARAAHQRRSRPAPCRPRRARRCSRGGEGEGADARRHRHRRRRQELAHRRAGPPLPPRPGRPAEDRHRLDRPVAAQVRRRAARRPHPDERDRAPEHLHALARHARGRQRNQQGAARRDRRVQGRRLRPGHRRDLGHRPGRRGDRAAGRRLAVRDDAGVRRRVAAGEDRHARLRRLRRDQQVRPQGRRRRAARRAQAVPAQPRAVQDAARRDAGVRHDRRALQRRRRDRALPGAGRTAGGQGPEARPGQAAAGRHAAVDRPERHRAVGARALSRRNRRDRARLPPVVAGAEPHRARAAAAAGGEGDARQPECKASDGRRSTRRASPPTATRSSTRAPRSCSTCGRRRRPRTPATNTW